MPGKLLQFVKVNTIDRLFDGMHFSDPFMENSTHNRGCVREARKLQRDLGGDVYMVLDIHGTIVSHAYLLTPGMTGNDLALNQKDNGYEGFPPLTADQVKEYGSILHGEPEGFM